MTNAFKLYAAAARDLAAFRSEFPDGKTSDSDTIDWFSEGRPDEVTDADDQDDAWQRYWSFVCELDRLGPVVITAIEQGDLLRKMQFGEGVRGDDGVTRFAFRDDTISVDHVVVLHDVAALRGRVELAAAYWTGLAWDTAPGLLAKALRSEQGLRSTDREDLEHGGCWWPADGSAQSQRLNARWQALLDAIERGPISEDVVAEAVSIAEDEARIVAAQAAAAAEHGSLAVDAATRGDFETALAELEEASRIERAYGDDPTWSRPLGLVRGWLED